MCKCEMTVIRILWAVAVVGFRFSNSFANESVPCGNNWIQSENQCLKLIKFLSTLQNFNFDARQKCLTNQVNYNEQYYFVVEAWLWSENAINNTGFEHSVHMDTYDECVNDMDLPNTVSCHTAADGQAAIKVPCNESMFLVCHKNGMDNLYKEILDLLLNASNTFEFEGLKDPQQQLGSGLHKRLLSLGDAMLDQMSISDVYSFREEKLTYYLKKDLAANFANSELVGEHVTIRFPRHIRDVYNNKTLRLRILISERHFFSTSDVQPSTHVITASLVGELQKEIMMDPEEPLVFLISVNFTFGWDNWTELNTVDNSMSYAFATDLVPSRDTILIELMNLHYRRSFSVLGRFDHVPSMMYQDLSFYAQDGKERNSSTRKNIKIYEYNDIIRVIVQSEKITEPTKFIISINIHDDRSLVAKKVPVNPSVRIMKIAAVTFDLEKFSCEFSTYAMVRDITDQAVQLESNFFGTFSLNMLIIRPNLIDFNNLILNFNERLAENPYVLVILLVVLFIFFVLLLYMRRLDKKDEIQNNTFINNKGSKRQITVFVWLLIILNLSYLPLVDNLSDGNYWYSLSLSTGQCSPRKFTATPWICLHGELMETSSRILKDNCRRNFHRGSVSNFMLNTKYHLGPLNSITVWHDNTGASPQWFINTISITDLTTNQKYDFQANQWFALDKDDGQIVRKLALHSTDSMQSMFNILFHRTHKDLLDYHLLICLLQNPGYSKFSRVQRISCFMSLVFLSLLTNAMWYHNMKEITKGLSLGPIEISYQNILISFQSSLLILVPCLAMLASFKFRSTRQQKPDLPVWKEKLTCWERMQQIHLPWWFIFVGYFLVLSTLLISSSLTFFYSLSWGRKQSFSWLVAAVFSLSSFVFLVQPLQIFVFSILITCIMKDNTKVNDENTDSGSQDDINWNFANQDPDGMVYRPPEMNREKIQLSREEMIMDNKLWKTSRGLLFRFFFIVLLSTLCLHNNPRASYYQNHTLRNLFHLDKVHKANGTYLDIWTWIETFLVPNLLPLYSYNGKILSVYEQRYLSDANNYRIGPIRFRQLRAKDNCKRLYTYGQRAAVCSFYFSENSEETRNFGPFWMATNGSTALNPFAYTEPENLYQLPQTGVYGHYQTGGYIIDVSVSHSYALDLFKTMKKYNWLDNKTRALSLEMAIINVNSQLFSQCKVLIEMPAFGNQITSSSFLSFRLYPYINAWDYMTLILQIIFLVITLIRVFIIIKYLLHTRWAGLKKVKTWAFICSLALALMAIISFGMRINLTISINEQLQNSKVNFLSFDYIVYLDFAYQLGISCVLFIAILDLLNPLTLNYHLFLMRASMIFSIEEVISYLIIFNFLLVAFGSILYCYIGSESAYFKNMATATLTLFRILIAMGKYHHLVEIDSWQIRIIIMLFTAFTTIILVNLFVSAINFTFDHIKNNIRNKEARFHFDQDLNDHFWKRLTAVWTGVMMKTKLLHQEDDM